MQKLVAICDFVSASWPRAVAEGALYGIGGLREDLLAPMLGPLGLVAWVALGLDSYSKSANGAHLWELKSPLAKPAS